MGEGGLPGLYFGSKMKAMLWATLTRTHRRTPAGALLRKARKPSGLADRATRNGIGRKQPFRMPFTRKFFDRFKPSKALRSWNGASELLRRGIETARPVAYFEKPGDISLLQNYYICEYVDADFSVRQIFSAFASGEKTYEGISEEDAYRQVSDFVLMMHGRGVFFRDLSGGNILVKETADNTLTFSLIDTGRAHFFNRGTPLSKRISDLTRICNKLHPEGRDRFMQMYLASIGNDSVSGSVSRFISITARSSLNAALKKRNPVISVFKSIFG